jgi:hypothetical protein
MSLTLRCGALGLLLSAVVGCRAPPKPAPPEPAPSIKSFTVSANRVARNQMVSFTFETERATTVSMVDEAGSTIATTFDATTQRGTATAGISKSSLYVLRAESDTGRDAAFVQVAVDEPLRELFLVVVPRVAKPGERVDIVWSASGGTNIQVRAGNRSLSTMAQGMAVDRPEVTTSYTLTARNEVNQTLTAEASVRIEPVIERFEASPPVARPGQVIELQYKTAGAETVTVTETTFGELFSGAAEADGGVVIFTVPTTFTTDAGEPSTDGGAALGLVRDGFPLKFTLRAETAMPMQVTTASINGRVGTGATIDRFDVPTDVTADAGVTVSWETTGANRVELLIGGTSVFRPSPGTQLDAAFVVPRLLSDSVFTLLAYDSTGLITRTSKTVTVVRPPVIATFTMPATASAPSNPVTANWQVQNARVLVLRVKDGPAIFTSNASAQVAMGSTRIAVGQTSTYVLEAYNAAGDRATAERRVTQSNPLTVAVTPNPSVTNAPVLLSWDIAGISPTDLAGLLPEASTAIIATGMSTNFVDLSMIPAAQEVRFSSADDAVASLSLPNGFTFPYANRAYRDVFVSTNGLVSLGSGLLSPNNVDFAAPGFVGPAILAPFWDDLSLGSTGKVWWFIDGDTFPRRLIVQWEKMAIDAEASAQVTFQLQLFETGKVRFVYGPLTGMQAGGNNATVGFHTGTLGAGRSYRFNMMGTAVNAGDEINWFTGESTRLVGSFESRLAESGPLGFFAETANGWLPVFAPVRVISPNSIVVNEVMPIPGPMAAEGRWVELFNPASAPVSIEGLVLQSRSGAMMPFTFPAGSAIDAGSYLVVGQSADTVANGGAPVDLTWNMGEVPLAGDDQAELRVGGTQADGGVLPFISALAWAATGDGGIIAGRSAQAAQRTVPVLTCPRMQTYGTSGLVGTPGARNEGCFEYDLDVAPFNFEDISDTPALSVTSGSNDDGVVASALPAPFTFFGNPESALTVCTNGWLVLANTTVTTLSNPTSPVSSSPRGVIAPFWDDLNMTGGATLHVARRGNRTIVQWTNFQAFSASGTLITFQVKLFDTGVIEFHYRDVANDPRSQGDSASVWIERPTGTAAALPISINQASLRPNTAFRFTPRN